MSQSTCLSNTRYVLLHSILYSNTHLKYCRHRTTIEKSCKQWSYSRIHIKLELLSNATTIDSALNYIRNKQQQQKGLALGSKDDQPATGSRQTVFLDNIYSCINQSIIAYLYSCLRSSLPNVFVH